MGDRRKRPHPWHGIFGNIMNYIVPLDAPSNPKKANKVNSKSEIIGEANWKILQIDSVVPGVVLSLWDHICGPREEQVWWNPNSIDRTILELNAPFTLQGQMGNMLDMDAPTEETKTKLERIEPKFLVLSSYFTCSLIFWARYNGQFSTFSLSFVFPKDELSRYLTLHHIVKDRMLQLVELYKKLAPEDPSEAVKALDEHLNGQLQKLHLLFRNQGMSKPLLATNDTLWGRATLDAHLKNFLGQVITSHLHTGSTLIVGPEKQVQTWVNTLSLFLLPHQRHISCSDVREGVENYIPDLALQGLVCSPEQIEDHKIIIQCTVPTTLVVLHGLDDNDSGTSGPNPTHPISSSSSPTASSTGYYVKQTHPYHEYIIIRKDYHKEEINKRIPQSKPTKSENNMWGTMDELLRNTEQAQIISDIIDKIYKLPNSHAYLRLGFINQSMSLLMRKAMVLIKYVEALLEMESPNNEGEVVDGGESREVQRSPANVPRKGGNGRGAAAGGDIPPSPPMTPRGPVENTDGIMEKTKRRIRIDMNLSDEASYFVLLGIAEKLKPGLYVAVAGNPAWIEEKLIELFERF